MGCGSSKAVDVANAPQAKQIKVQANGTEATPKKSSIKPTDQHSPDSGVSVAESEMVTENSKNANTLADEDRPPTPDLCIEGKGASNNENSCTTPPPGNRSSGDTLDPPSPQSRDQSATSIRSAPVMLERPSSRGGSAFDLSFDDENKDLSRNAPRRLGSLSRRHSGKKKKELSLEELQAKLQAAEERKRDIERRLIEKASEETRKAEIIKRSPSRSSLRSRDGDKEKTVEENREAHLKALRDRLKEKEEKAKLIRERKKALQENGSTQ